MSRRAVSFWTRQAPPDGEAVRRLYREGKTEREIARLVGVSRRHVAEAMAEAGVERRRSGLPRPVSREALYSLAVDKGLSQGRLARMFGVAEATISIWLAECGLDEPDPRIDHDRLRELYVESRLTTREIAARLGVDHHRVIRELALAGIPRRARYERPPKGPRATLTVEALRQLYVEQGLSIDEIAKSAVVSTEYVCNRVHEHRLAKRPGSFRPKTPYIHRC